jgi:peptide/nickel transport system permease protein
MSAVTAEIAQLRAPLRLRLPFRGDALSRAALGVLVVFVAFAVLGPLLPLGNAETIGIGPRLAGPTWDWPAGTDSLGRSVLPRLVEGVRTTFLLAALAVTLSAAVGVLTGITAAYFGGLVGEIVVRGADVLFAFPSLLLALLIVALVGPGTTSAIISIAIVTFPMMVRVVRAASLRVVSRDFILAAQVARALPARIVIVHLLPNVAGTAVVQATYALSVGMLIEGGLSFLGLGVQPPQASLGSLVFEGSVYLPIAPWLVLVPGALLALAIMSVNLVGDGLRDLLDVRAEEVRQ